MIDTAPARGAFGLAWAEHEFMALRLYPRESENLLSLSFGGISRGLLIHKFDRPVKGTCFRVSIKCAAIS
jgi:hypothetical protein